AWMAFFCLNMFRMAMELAQENPVYEDMASKYFEHFVAITDAMNCLGGHGLWDDEDGFYYDQIHVDDHCVSLKIRSLVGLLPLIAVHTFDECQLANMPNFYKRMQWFLTYRADLAKSISYAQEDHDVRILAIPSRERLERLLAYLLDEDEFLSPYGIRSLSKYHEKNPFSFFAGGKEHRVQYMPNESDTGMFGVNSNWRGPIWFPLNYLIVESLLRYYHFFGDTLKVECPTRSGNMMNLEQVSQEIARRLSSIFLPDKNGVRPCNGEQHKYAEDPSWKNLVLFYEYFNPETGRGLGADHQTGWTALVADLLARERWDKLVNGARVILDVART
ncbi:MAG: glucosidase, partial [Cyanobacteria bacterium PR.3.49]|nr:glucosidase [Cyanobacteria bacterium PR.3.49]